MDLTHFLEYLMYVDPLRGFWVIVMGFGGCWPMGLSMLLAHFVKNVKYKCIYGEVFRYRKR